MKPEAQRIAIAEACGLKSIRHYDGPMASIQGNLVGQHPFFHDNLALVPNYPEDLNEIHHAILFKFTDNDSAALYLTELEDVVQTWMIDGGIRFAHLEYWVANATADQCCEAFLKAIGKWKDDDK